MKLACPRNHLNLQRIFLSRPSPLGVCGADHEDFRESHAWASRQLPPDMPPAETGATLAAMPAKGLALRLRPAAEVNFIAAPRRPSRSEVPRGGRVTFEVAHAGGYLVTISGDGWLDARAGPPSR